MKTKGKSAKEVITVDSAVKKDVSEKKARKPRRRIFPIWLRIIVVLMLSALALIIGAIIGYGVLGDGSPLDVLKIETWQHIIDIVKKEQ